MKFITTLLLAALMAYAIGMYTSMPWWSFAITNLIVAIAIPQKPFISFLSGALAVGLLWACLSMIIDQSNHHILATKVATILPMKGSYVLLILVTSIVGGLVGGLASLTGSFLRLGKA
jgi:hypothetical protein